MVAEDGEGDIEADVVESLEVGEDVADFCLEPLFLTSDPDGAVGEILAEPSSRADNWILVDRVAAVVAYP